MRIDYRESSNTRYTLHAVPEPATPSTIAERLAVCRRRCEIVEQHSRPNPERAHERIKTRGADNARRPSHAKGNLQKGNFQAQLRQRRSESGTEHTKVAGRECESERERAGNGRRERKCAYDGNFPRLVAAAQKRKTKTKPKPKTKTKGEEAQKQLHAVALCVSVWQRGQRGKRREGGRQAAQGRAGLNVGLPVA